MNDQPPPERPTFLIIDDDPLVVHAMAKALRPLGKVAFSTEYDRVHVVAALSRPRVMLIDVDLPQVTGLDIVRRLRLNPDLDSVHVLLMTAHRGKSVLEEARSLTVDEVLTKPIDTASLVASIKELL
jgi:putative two-component system response regulator